MKKELFSGLKKIGFIIMILGMITLLSFLVMDIGKDSGNYLIITSPDCEDCDISVITKYLSSILPDYSSKEIDVYSAEGYALRYEFNIVTIPAIYFNRSIERSEAFKRNDDFRNLLKQGYGGGYLLTINSTHFIDTKAKIIQDYEMANGTVVDRLKVLDVDFEKIDKVPQIDFFLIPFDNYSNIIEREMKLVYDDLKDEAIFYPRFIVRQGNITGCEYLSCSQNGIMELHEVARELCGYYRIGPDFFFKYALLMNNDCDSYNADECWAEKMNSTDSLVIKDCYEDIGRNIIIDERKVSSGILNITRPIIFINGIEYDSLIDGESIKLAICKEYDISYMPESCVEEFL